MSTKSCYMKLVVLIILIDELKGQKPCLASNNQKWKSKRDKCVDCSPCPTGKARNFTELYTGPSVLEGDTQCLPCRDCPKGFYARESGCLPCRKDCVNDYNREFAEICEGSHDARCGSCLFGYEDAFKHIDYHCIVKDDSATGSKNEVTTVVDTPNDDTVTNSTNDDEVVLEVRSLDAEEDNNDVIIFVVVGTAILTILVIMGGVWLCRRKLRITGLTNLPEQGGEDNDLQIDGARSQYSSQNEVRGELGVDEHLLPRPELPRTVNGAYTQLPGIVPTLLIRCDPNTVCKCEHVPNCQCYLTGLPNTQNIQIDKSDEYLLLASKNICHKERRLYDELKLSDAEVFAKEEDRRADIDRIPFNEKVLSLLNRWVEIGPTETVTLHTLMKALCKSGFHKINQTLIKKLQSDGVSFLENDNGGAL